MSAYGRRLSLDVLLVQCHDDKDLVHRVSSCNIHHTLPAWPDYSSPTACRKHDSTPGGVTARFLHVGKSAAIATGFSRSSPVSCLIVFRHYTDFASLYLYQCEIHQLLNICAARFPPRRTEFNHRPSHSDFRTWESYWTMPLVGGFSRGYPVSPAHAFRSCSILTSDALIGSHYLAVKIQVKQRIIPRTRAALASQRPWLAQPIAEWPRPLQRELHSISSLCTCLLYNVTHLRFVSGVSTISQVWIMMKNFIVSGDWADMKLRVLLEQFSTSTSFSPAGSAPVGSKPDNLQFPLFRLPTQSLLPRDGQGQGTVMRTVLQISVKYTTAFAAADKFCFPLFRRRSPVRVHFQPLRSVVALTNLVPPAGMKGWGKREIPEKTRRPAASYGTTTRCENPGVTRPGIEPGSPWWEMNMQIGTDVCALITVLRQILGCSLVAKVPLELACPTTRPRFFVSVLPASQHAQGSSYQSCLPHNTPKVLRISLACLTTRPRFFVSVLPASQHAQGSSYQSCLPHNTPKVLRISLACLTTRPRFFVSVLPASQHAQGSSYQSCLPHNTPKVLRISLACLTTRPRFFVSSCLPHNTPKVLRISLACPTTRPRFFVSVLPASQHAQGSSYQSCLPHNTPKVLRISLACLTTRPRFFVSVLPASQHAQGSSYQSCLPHNTPKVFVSVLPALQHAQGSSYQSCLPHNTPKVLRIVLPASQHAQGYSYQSCLPTTRPRFFVSVLPASQHAQGSSYQSCLPHNTPKVLRISLACLTTRPRFFVSVLPASQHAQGSSYQSCLPHNTPKVLRISLACLTTRPRFFVSACLPHNTPKVLRISLACLTTRPRFFVSVLPASQHAQGSSYRLACLTTRPRFFVSSCLPHNTPKVLRISLACLTTRPRFFVSVLPASQHAQGSSYQSCLPHNTPKVLRISLACLTTRPRFFVSVLPASQHAQGSSYQSCLPHNTPKVLRISLACLTTRPRFFVSDLPASQHAQGSSYQSCLPHNTPKVLRIVLPASQHAQGSSYRLACPQHAQGSSYQSCLPHNTPKVLRISLACLTTRPRFFVSVLPAHNTPKVLRISLPASQHAQGSSYHLACPSCRKGTSRKSGPSTDGLKSLVITSFAAHESEASPLSRQEAFHTRSARERARPCQRQFRSCMPTYPLT
ncbi:hypothetical protein PR048_010766 [Dryococelus australis]|uniref:Uncharacterized protein n=1 Tax=Dryococelus australis TaxID=614101 RepID=A0ABQ9I4P4_9NEOP|nr:hypothetical protein PR048_010766 [Dryococelus australis]